MARVAMLHGPLFYRREQKEEKDLTQRKRRGVAEGAEKRERRSQRGSGKTRRLRLPVMTTARKRASGEMAKSRTEKP